MVARIVAELHQRGVQVFDRVFGERHYLPG